MTESKERRSYVAAAGTLVLKVRAGDKDAFTQLVLRYQTMAYGYALATTGDVHLAEDATQQAFLTSYLNLAALRDPERFGGWLRGIVRFECLRLLRDRRRHTLDTLENTAETVPIEPSGEPEAQAEARESFDRALAMLARLPERQRIAATLYYL
jgi:RNA polymerase sigma factor (sigma-70 family)